MSHLNSVSPPGPLTVQPSSVTTFTVDATAPADESLSINLLASDGSTVVLSVLKDAPDFKLVFGGTAPLAANEVRVTATGGVVAPVAGQPKQFTWQAPA